MCSRCTCAGCARRSMILLIASSSIPSEGSATFSKSGRKMVHDTRPHPRRTMSIALRMTVWYALTAFSLTFVATGVLYWVLVTSLYQQYVSDLADNLNNARLLLESSPTGRLLQPPDRRPPWAPPHQPATS